MKDISKNKKWFVSLALTTFAFVFLLGAVIPSLSRTASAQTCTDPYTGETFPCSAGDDGTGSGFSGFSPGSVTNTADDPGGELSAGTIKSAYVKASESSNVPSLLEMFEDPSKFVSFIAQNIAEGMLTLFSSVVFFAGKLLDAAMYFTAHMKEILDGLPIVDTGWAIFRDLANMVFIFILVYASISIVLGIGNPRQLIVNIIITAILLNFSLFITKAIVDASNLVALQFYDAINVKSDVEQGPEGYLPWAKDGPAAAFMQGLKLATIYDYDRHDKSLTSIASLAGQQLTVPDILPNPFRMITIAIMSSIVMLVAAFVFAAGAFMLFFRIIMLMFLMMISPLAFIARVLPMTQQGWSKWWNALLRNAIFAPAYLAMSYIIVSIVGDGFVGISTLNVEGGSFFFSWAGMISSLGVVVNFIFMIAILLMALVLAKQIGSFGATATIKIGQNAARGMSRWVGKVTGAPGAVAGWATRRTVGEGARKLEEKWGTSEFGTTRTGRFLRSFTTTAASKAKFAGKSAEEQYKEDRKLKEAHEVAGTRKNVLTAVAGAANIPDARERNRVMQAAVATLSPDEFATIPRKQLLQSPEILQNASGAQINAAFRNDWTAADKKEALRVRYAPVKKASENYATAMKAYLPQKEAYEQYEYETKNNLPHTLPAPPTKPVEPKFDPTAYEFIRGFREGELEYVHQAYPEFLSDEFTFPVFRYSALDYYRKSPNVAQAEGETARVSKNYAQFSAVGAAAGVDGYNEEFMAYDLGARRKIFSDAGKLRFAYAKSKAGLPLTEDEQKLLKTRAYFTDASGKVFLQHKDEAGNEKARFVIASNQNRQQDLESRADGMIADAFGERAADELAKIPGACRNQAAAILQYGRDVFSKMQVDTKEYRELVEPLLVAYGVWKSGGAEMSRKSKDSLYWMLNVKEGQSFFSKATLDPGFQKLIDKAKGDATLKS